MATPTSSATFSESPTDTLASATPSCTHATPDKYGHVPPEACNSNYPFDPSFGGNLAFALLMGLTMVVHFIQAIAYKKRFCWVLLVGASWETISFSLRTAGSRDQQQIAYAIVGTLLLLLAPLWINAFLYMTIARLIHYIIPDQKVWRIRASLLTKIFVWLDVVAFLVQAAGGSILSNNEQTEQAFNLVRIGQKIYMAGIGIQLGFILIFSALTWSFYRRMSQENRPDRPVRKAKLLVWIIYAVFVLIIVRIIYRMVEFTPGVGLHNPILTNENYTFGLDGFPVFLGLALLNIVHPGLVLRGPESEFKRVTRKEKKAIKQEKKDQKREKKDLKKQAKADKKAGRKGNPMDAYESPESDRDGGMV